ncbi:MAG TPA: VCBS domain-containing protein, partial [Microvirga sp.]|nr:VCBS domain-containing protein [Microvirga sp.]
MVEAWGNTTDELDGFAVNNPGGVDNGIQSRPVVADNSGENFGIVYFTQGADGTHVRFQGFNHDLGPMDEIYAGPANFDDGLGTISVDVPPAVVGWGDGYVGVWQEEDAAGSLVLRARITSPTGLLGGEFSLDPVSGNAAEARQHSVALTPYIKATAELDDRGRPVEALGFTAVWVEDTGEGTLGRIKLQKFQVTTDALGEPDGIEPAGIDGEVGRGSEDGPGDDDAVLDLGPGRSPSVAGAHDGETIVIWVERITDQNGAVSERPTGRVFDADGEVNPFSAVLATTLAAIDDLAPGQAPKAVPLGAGNFGVFWVAQTDEGLVIKGQTFQLLDGAATWVPGSARDVVSAADMAALGGFDGTFSLAGLGETNDGGTLTFATAMGVHVRYFNADGVPVGSLFPVGVPGSNEKDHAVAGLVGDRAVVVWAGEGAADGGDIEAQIVDMRTPGQKLVGDRDDGEEIDARVDLIVGTIGNDTIIADRGDTEDGEGETDTVIAAMGDDTLHGGGEADILDGGEGYDVATYTGQRHQYSITINADGSFTVKDMRLTNRGRDPGPDGVDVIRSIEELAFGSSLPTQYQSGDQLTVGSDRLGTDLFFQNLPPVVDHNGTPQYWGLTGGTGPFTVGSNAPGVQHTSVTTALEDGFGVVWQAGGRILLQAYSPLGRPDAAFGGLGAQVFDLGGSTGAISGLSATMAGDLGVIAVWVENGVLTGRFASALDGVRGQDEIVFPVPASEGFDPAAPAGSPAVAGYEIVDANNDTVEFGFHVAYVQDGQVVLQRFTLIDADGVPDPNGPQPAGEPILLGSGSAPAIIGLHDGEIVIAWIDGGFVRTAVYAPETNGTVVSFHPVAVDPQAPSLATPAQGASLQIASLVTSAAVAYLIADGRAGEEGLQSAVYVAILSPDGVQVGSTIFLLPEGATGEFRITSVGEDDLGSEFALFYEVAASANGPASIWVQRFSHGGEEIGEAVRVFADGTTLADGTFSAAGLLDGRLVVTADLPGGGITAQILDTRTPGEPIAGPREGAPRDFLVGTAEGDAIDGHDREDEIHGALGNDLITGGTENDLLFGEDGNDTLVGGSENDLLDGGTGDDLLLGGFGVDTINGGDGNDTVSYQGEFANFQINLATGIVQSNRNPATGAVQAFATEDTLTSVENAVGGEGNDFITGNALANVLNGRGGDDTFSGGGGNDTIDGGGGADLLVLSGALADYDVTYDTSSGRFTLTHARGAAADGRVTVTNVESFRFSDGTVSRDVLAGNAPPPTNHPATGTVTISGILREGQLLTAAVSALLDEDGNGNGDLHYTWRRSSDGQNWETVGTGLTLEIGEGDGGYRYQVIVSFIDGAGNLETLTSAQTAPATYVDAGVVVDGYLSGAQVWGDANGDGAFNDQEVSATTNSSGQFSLEGYSGPILARGGTDIATGLPFQGTLSAPAGSTVISPLTTLVAELMKPEAADGPGLPLAEALIAVRAALGLPEVDLLHINPIAGAMDDNENAVALLAAGAVVINAVSVIVAASNSAATPELVFAELAHLIATTDEGQIFLGSDMIVEILTDLNVAPDMAAAVAAVIGELTEAARAAVAAAERGVPAIEILKSIAALGIVAQRDIPNAFDGEVTTPETLQEDFTGLGLEHALEAAGPAVGDVDGDGQNDGSPAPSVTLINVAPLTENMDTANGVKVADILTTNTAGMTLSVAGADAELFQIRSGAVGPELWYVGSSPDFETQFAYDVTVVADDPETPGTEASVDLTVNVTDIDESGETPELILSDPAIAENVDGGVVGTLSVAGVDLRTFTFTVSDDRFVVTLDETGVAHLKLKDGITLDYESEKTLAVTVTCSDGHGTSLSKEFALTVEDRDDSTGENDVPNIGTGDFTGEVDEDGPLSDSGSIAFTDPDTGSHTVSVTGPGGALGTFTALVGADATAGQSGRIDWNFQVDGDAVAHLREGETITQKYQVTVAEAGGSGQWSGDEEFTVATDADYSYGPFTQQTAVLKDGGFVVVWSESREGAAVPDIYARIFDASGEPRGNDFKVNMNSYMTGGTNPVVVALDDGGFVIAWQSDSDDPSEMYSYGISGQAFGADGARLGDEFLVNAETAGDQTSPAIVPLEGGRFAVTWTSEEVSPSGIGTIDVVKGQVFEVDAEAATIVATGHASALPDFMVADANDHRLTVTLRAANGTISGLADEDLDEEGIQISGTARELNKLLKEATFTAQVDGAASIAITVDDDEGGRVTSEMRLYATTDIDPTISGLPTRDRLTTTGVATNLPDIVVSDANNDILQVTLVATNGVLGNIGAGGTSVTIQGTPAQVNAQLAAASFTATENGAASVEITVNDGNGGIVSRTLSLTATDQNSVPILYGSNEDPGNAPTVPLGRPVPLGELVVMDFDNDFLSVTINAVNGVVGGLEDEDGNALNGIQISGTVEEINNALEQATFQVASADSLAHVSITVEDGRGGIATGKLAFTGDAGMATSPIVSGIPLDRLAAEPGRAIDLPDVTVDGSGQLRATLYAINGEIRGVEDADEFEPGIQIVGTAAQINAALADAEFRPEADGIGYVDIVVQNGDFHSGSGTIVINVSSENVTPTITGTSRPVLREGDEVRVTPLEPPSGQELFGDIDAKVTTPLKGGGFVQTWSWPEGDFSTMAVMVQAYDEDGNKVGGPVYANKRVPNDAASELLPSSYLAPIGVTALADGGFVLIWEDLNGSQGGAGLSGRVFNADGSARTPIFGVSSPDDGLFLAGDIEVVGLTGGGFAVAWSNSGTAKAYARAFDANGNPQGSSVVLSEGHSSAYEQIGPRLAADSSGGFVVVWEASKAGEDTDIYLQGFSASGTARGAGIQVNTNPVGDQTNAQVVETPAGLMVTWTSYASGTPTLQGRLLRQDTSGSATTEVTVVIHGQNDRPTAENEVVGQNLVEDETAEVAGSVADRIGDVDSGEAALLKVVAACLMGGSPQDVASGSGETAVIGRYGTLYIKPDGSYRYVLDNTDLDTQALARDELVQEIFSYKVSNGDGDDDEATAEIRFSIRGVNDAPTTIALLGAVVDENTAGAVIGTLVAEDLDSDGITFEALDDRFEVTGNQLKLKNGVTLDFEDGATVTVRVRASDGDGGFIEQDLEVAVNDIAEEPVGLSLGNVTEVLPENTNIGARIKVADILVEGGIEVGALHLEGADAACFEIIGDGLYLKGGTLLDYEGKRNFEVRVAAAGGV